MCLSDVCNNNKNEISFEIFPPKDDVEGSKKIKLFKNLEILKRHNPQFISLTCGAGGTNNSASLTLISELMDKFKIDVIPHFTCINMTQESVKQIINKIYSLDVKSVLALRGDMPIDAMPINYDFKHAIDLIHFINQIKPNYFSICVAGYPEGHIEADNFEVDFEYLKQKIDAGAKNVLTQMFFDNSKFLDFTEKVHSYNSEVKVVPGIMPIISVKQLDRMLSMIQVSLPDKLKEKLEKYKDSPNEIKKIGIDYATYQCQDLIDNGVKSFHFFTLNLAKSTDAILTNLGI